ncbi:MAG: heparan-alpha-glucosaminide N-acetyltransferase domain-containing protein [Saonia sp.]
MKSSADRLYFIDAMRAWAILMMLQGHFVVGLLSDEFKDMNNPTFYIWDYFRGVTAPVFFAVSGFIFTFLLLKKYSEGWKNHRVQAGVQRGLQLILIGHLLQLRIPGLFKGILNDSFYIAHVLQCVGVSILLIIGIYLFSYTKKKFVFPTLLFLTGILVFALKPIYDHWDYAFLPELFANYFTAKHGSVFTIFPWFGYAAFGGLLSVVFSRYGSKVHFFPIIISIVFFLGFFLIFYSEAFFLQLHALTQWSFFEGIYQNNYLFARLGNVLLIFAVFMQLRSLIKHPIILKIGQNTLPIYVIHSIILYGSGTGYGLTLFFHRTLSPLEVIVGMLLFVFGTTIMALAYAKYKKRIGILGTITMASLHKMVAKYNRTGMKRLQTYYLKVIKLFSYG